jgi:ABC-type nickel/cobalt efflux system permease component RcnA
MESIISAQRWLYGEMASGLADVAGGRPGAILAALAAAILFGSIHALMPGHGKMVLASYHLGQKTRGWDALVNGTILTLTHVGLAVLLVLAGFAVIARAFAYGGRTPQFELASGALIFLMGAFLLWRSIAAENQHGSGGKKLAFVTGLIPCPLTTFIMSFALARNMLAAGLAVTAAMALGMIMTIAGAALLATLAREKMVMLLNRTASWRHHAGSAMEIAGSVMVLGLGLWMIFGALAAPA